MTDGVDAERQCLMMYVAASMHARLRIDWPLPTPEATEQDPAHAEAYWHRAATMSTLWGSLRSSRVTLHLELLFPAQVHAAPWALAALPRAGESFWVQWQGPAPAAGAAPAAPTG